MDYKLKIFKEVALTESFSQAAKRLNLSQPAVSKTIKNLEETYGQVFFDRKANKIELTFKGKMFLEYAEKILSIYQEMNDNLSEDNQSINEKITIGASTTIANYILPQLIATLQDINPTLKINLIAGNTNDIQQQILKKQIDFGIVEGKNHNTRLHYERFINDELVLVNNTKNTSEIEREISTEGIKKIPLVRREIGSGTREVIENAMKDLGIKLSDSHPVFGSTESIKNYLLYSNNYAFLSIHSIIQDLKGNRLRVIEIDDFRINRWFYFITRQGGQSKNTLKLKRALLGAYNKK